jgi:hypothetical protein
VVLFRVQKDYASTDCGYNKQPRDAEGDVSVLSEQTKIAEKRLSSGLVVVPTA